MKNINLDVLFVIILNSKDFVGFVEYLESNDIGFYSKDYDAHWVWLDEIFDDINTEEEKACVAMAVRNEKANFK